MPIKASSLEEVGDIFMTTFGDYQTKLLYELWDNLMETTPERTGTLRFNWRFKPGSLPGSGFAENDGTPKPWPREPQDIVYKKAWKEFTVYNNSPYIVIVNNGEGGNENNQNFIQRAMQMTNVKL